MRIVCFHLNQIGDLMFSLPALKSLRDSFSPAYITSVIRPGLRQLLEWTNLADDVLVRSPGLGSHVFSLMCELRSRRYDLAVVFSQSAECALLAYMTRASRRLGFVNTSLGWLLTERVSFSHPPSTANNLRLVEAAGAACTKKDYYGLLSVPLDVVEAGRRLLASTGIDESVRFAVIAPGTSKRRRLKEWTDEGFAEVARYLGTQGLRVVCVGAVASPGIAQLCPQIVDLGGRTSLVEAAGVLAGCELLVGVDSGILHMCAAMGKPVVGLYGPTNPEVTGPQGEGHIVIRSNVGCSPCRLKTCKLDRKCMKDIKPVAVIDAVSEILRRRHASSARSGLSNSGKDFGKPTK
ncbi:MAG: glycosyltransferase family 9 protein [Armatimonadota bacterium]|nr:glycosyltransferase family 9 protein [Armatimonadota bacterium]